MKEATRYVRQYLWSLFAAKKYADSFEDISAYCMFIGLPRSGSTLAGALLTAHPEMAIAHELDALKYVQGGISRNQLYALLLRRDRQFVESGTKAQEFDYRVPNQWQGRFQTLKVIGDKRAAASTERLQTSPELLQRLRELVQVPVRLVHMVRNPFDNISTMARRAGSSLEENIQRYFRASDINARLIESSAGPEIITLRHEDLIAQPRESLKRLVEFVGVRAEDGYLSDCAGVLFSAPSKTRLKMPWERPLIDGVQARIAEYSFLRGYSFEN